MPVQPLQAEPLAAPAVGPSRKKRMGEAGAAGELFRLVLHDGGTTQFIPVNLPALSWYILCRRWAPPWGADMLYDKPYDPYANIRWREQHERLRDDIGGPPMQHEAKPVSLWWYIFAISLILKVAHSFAQHPASLPVRDTASPQTQETSAISDGGAFLLVIVLILLVIILWKRWLQAKQEQAPQYQHQSWWPDWRKMQEEPMPVLDDVWFRDQERRLRERERAQRAREQEQREQAERAQRAWEQEQQQRNQQEARAQQARERAQREEQEQREREECAQREQRAQREREQQERAQKKRARREQQGGPQGTRPWWEVLGVSQGSSWDEVKAAYRTKIKQYHPDRVLGLGEEFQHLADRKTRELDEAFNEAKRRAST
jgi:DnaJ-domain-containing protein 1